MASKKIEIQSPKPSSAHSLPRWIELPREVTENILHRLGTVQILESAQYVCRTWWNVCNDPFMWRVIDMTNSGRGLDGIKYHPLPMYRHAVDRSQGRAVEINIEYFCTVELLLYIAQRCDQLKCLRLASCCRLSGKSLIEVSKKFQQLEELHILFLPSISARDVVAIGQSCPMLKSFTYNEYIECYPLLKDDESAFAVANNMSGLCHLQLFGNTMTNKGLQAILDGCPHLESLDIRRCSNIILEGDIRKRCSQQLHDLKRPSDTVYDYERAKFDRFQVFNIVSDPSYSGANNYFGFSYS